MTESAASAPYTPPVTKEVSLLDGLLVLARYKGLIAGTTVLFIVLGVLVALMTPPEYTSSAVLVREAGDGAPSGGGLAALRGLGLSIGGGETGLTAEAYPSILTSREIQGDLLDDPFVLASGETVTLQQFLEANAGGGFKGWLKGLFGGDDSAPDATPSPSDSLAVRYGHAELEAMDQVRQMVGVETDTETGLMTVTVTARDPVLAASLAARLIEELRQRVQAIRTQKAREDFDFIRERVAEAEADLDRVRARLARFDDQNRGLNSARLLAERSRLNQEVAFAGQVYGEYQSELKQAEIQVQRASPVLTVLDRPVVPLLPSRPKKKQVVLLWTLLGLGLGMGLAVVAAAVSAESASEGGRRKREALREALRVRRQRRKAQKAGQAEHAEGSTPD